MGRFSAHNPALSPRPPSSLLSFMPEGRMTLEELRSDKRQMILAIADKHGVTSVRVFGSFARGEAREDSDLYLLIDSHGIGNPSQPFIEGLKSRNQLARGCRLSERPGSRLTWNQSQAGLGHHPSGSPRSAGADDLCPEHRRQARVSLRCFTRSTSQVRPVAPTTPGHCRAQ